MLRCIAQDRSNDKVDTSGKSKTMSIDDNYSKHIDRLARYKYANRWSATENLGGQDDEYSCNRSKIDIDIKEHASQIDSVYELSNGDIAVSGGPLNYEVLIYRQSAAASKDKSARFEIVDSVSTRGEQV